MDWGCYTFCWIIDRQFLWPNEHLHHQRLYGQQIWKSVHCGGAVMPEQGCWFILAGSSFAGFAWTMGFVLFSSLAKNPPNVANFDCNPVALQPLTCCRNLVELYSSAIIYHLPQFEWNTFQVSSYWNCAVQQFSSKFLHQVLLIVWVPAFASAFNFWLATAEYLIPIALVANVFVVFLVDAAGLLARLL